MKQDPIVVIVVMGAVAALCAWGFLLLP